MLAQGFACAKFAETQLRLQNNYENSKRVVVLICCVERGRGGRNRREHAGGFAARAAVADLGETARIHSVRRRRGFVPGVLRVLPRKNGKGDGPVARSKGHGAGLDGDREEEWGKFPTARVRRIIEGEGMIASHGTREMPVWGPIFSQVEADVDREPVRIENLLKYLESIQAISK